MPQTRLYLTSDRATAERLFPALEAAFEEDGFPIAILEVDEDRDIHEISVYVEDEPDPVEARTKAILSSLAVTVPVERETLPDIDWVARSLEGLKPVRAGRFLVHGSHDRHRRRIGDLAIEIDAGLAFGTGHHGTTAGCLELIERIVQRKIARP